MSGESKGTFSRNWVELPTAPTAITPTAGGDTYNLGGGWIYTLTGTTAVAIDLSTIDYTGPIAPDAPMTAGRGAADSYVTIKVVGAVPIYIAGYPSMAAYTAAKPTIAGTLGVNPSGFSWPIYPSLATGPDPGEDAGRFLVRYGINHVLGIISSSTPTVYIRRSGAYTNAR